MTPHTTSITSLACCRGDTRLSLLSESARTTRAAVSNCCDSCYKPDVTELFAIGQRWETGEDGRTTVILVLTGEFDIEAAEELTGAVVGAVEDSRTDAVTVDLAGTTFIDSKAIGAVLTGYTAARSADMTFRLVNATGVVRRMLEVIGLLDSPGPYDNDTHSPAAAVRPLQEHPDAPGAATEP
ncbi:STAS domain-containing protein [Actinoplanes sp. NPDC049802]|uniref:STAS domain-containing protein n=1 Tax=Actinoplanes sp. NPDC049802 TaxID=3154742 RepID=UPI0033CCAB78